MRGMGGYDQPILQNAVYENIGKPEKVVYVFVRVRGRENLAVSSMPVV
jgi:hypothetical protein